MKPEWKGYETKAASIIGWMKSEEEDDLRYLRRDGQWARLGSVPNVGSKMLIWMMDQGMIVRRGSVPGNSATAIVYDWYRLAAPDDADDLGDLWVE